MLTPTTASVDSLPPVTLAVLSEVDDVAVLTSPTPIDKKRSERDISGFKMQQGQSKKVVVHIYIYI